MDPQNGAQDAKNEILSTPQDGKLNDDDAYDDDNDQLKLYSGAAVPGGHCAFTGTASVYSQTPITKAALSLDSPNPVTNALRKEVTANLQRVGSCYLVQANLLGFAGSEFGQVLAASPAGGSVYAATGSAPSIASGRLSYTLGLHGPCVSYDTACSAALAASHAGLRALQLAECGVGLVVGVTLMLAPGVGTSFAVAGMTSARGRSHTFDERADGYARGEACGGVTLSYGDGLLGLLGSAIRQDGRSASLTAPNGSAQRTLLLVATLLFVVLLISVVCPLFLYILQ